MARAGSIDWPPRHRKAVVGRETPTANSLPGPSSEAAGPAIPGPASFAWLNDTAQKN